MGMFYCRKDWFDGLSVKNTELLESTLAEVRVGEPALYDVAGNEFFVWADWRIGWKQAARMGRDLKDLANRSLIVVPDFEANPLVDPLKLAMDVQGGPADFNASSQLPDGATPVDPEV
jgi:hypothetical protein